MRLDGVHFDHVTDVMLQPGVVELPWHPLYNTNAVAEWKEHPSMNGNLGGVNSIETIVLK